MPASARSTPARLAIVTGTNERPMPGAAEHEGREQIPEVVPVDRQPGEQRHRRGRGEQPGGERRADAEPADDDLGDVRGDDDGQREAANATPLWIAE